ncbi:hypothetical protein AOQ88_01140 [Candidatus Riesia sp. GBBU]|nr:hypothetical protein AOQ88_01140 [Candidatus Riesia sp. GBBU]
MNKKLNIAISQLNFSVGDIKKNYELILKNVLLQKCKNVDIILFSEMSLVGYPIKDLLFKKDLYELCNKYLYFIQKISYKLAIVIGHPWIEYENYYNAISMFYNGKLVGRYFKRKLPVFWDFQESRYFKEGKKKFFVSFKGYNLAFLISEDIFIEDFDKNIEEIEIFIVISATPINSLMEEVYTRRLKYICKNCNASVIYINQVGGQDELVFQGGSKVLNNNGKIILNFPFFKEKTLVCKFKDLNPIKNFNRKFELSYIEKIYNALVISTHDYVKKNKFSKIILGVSGGIDSSLALAIAVDAIGRRNVIAVTMPSKYSKAESIKCVYKQKKLLDIEVINIQIDSIVDLIIKILSPFFSKIEKRTIENLQSRCRSVILMFICNQKNCLLLNTSNKSESSVGYTTIYGDMSGGFSVLKDIKKSEVFFLSEYRNKISLAIPEEVFHKKPSAELSIEQYDENELYSYSLLDKIIEEHIEKNRSFTYLTKLGFQEFHLKKIVKLFYLSEYKRKQSPVGPLIGTNSFHKNVNFPITSGYFLKK